MNVFFYMFIHYLMFYQIIKIYVRKNDELKMKLKFDSFVISILVRTQISISKSR